MRDERDERDEGAESAADQVGREAAPADEFPPEALEEARRLNEMPDQDPEESTGIDV